MVGIVERLEVYRDALALTHGDQSLTYRQLIDCASKWRVELRARDVRPGQCVAVTGAMSAQVVAMLLALIENTNIVIPILSVADAQRAESLRVGCTDVHFEFAADGTVRHTSCGHGAAHPLLEQLRGDRPEAGLILFTSGSAGRSKAAVHRFARLIENVSRKPGKPWRTLLFLMFDHIGGMNTLLHALCHGGTVVLPTGRSVAAVCATIERHGVELLPTTPTFLNMMLISCQFERHDLSSLRLVTYGTEPMPEATLRTLSQRLPALLFKQTYGLTEAGILPTKSEAAGSTWMQMGGENHATRIVDGILWIRSEAAMLGYLNAPSPFDADGWLNTGDRVEVREGYLRVLGRDSELINVAGEKVYPAEVESVILRIENVADVTVTAKASALTGQVVVAAVQVVVPEAADVVERRVRRYCAEQLPPHKVPMMVKVTTEPLFGLRFKKLRSTAIEDPVLPGEAHAG